MNVLVQKNIWEEYGYDRCLNSFREAGDNHGGVNLQEVHVIPFKEDFEDEVTMVPDLVFGSNRFVNICRKKGYPTFRSFFPGPCFYESHLWVNGRGEYHKWKDLKILYPVFLKPFTEKFFTGTVVNCQEDLEKIQLSTSFIDKPELELVWMSNLVRIQQEVRFFVIGGSIVTGSVYRTGNNRKQFRVDPYHPSWEAVHKIINNRFVSDAFVIDVGLVDGKWKIVELNNINSSGFYETDVDAIVRMFRFLHEMKRFEKMDSQNNQQPNEPPTTL